LVLILQSASVPVIEELCMDEETKDRFAIRCIVVSTQSGMTNIARAHRDDPERRDRLQEATLERGNALLSEMEREHALSRALQPVMRAARAALGT
jgi:hypothetical protein